MATPDDLFGRLSELGIKTQTHDHAPVFTVADSQTLRGAIRGSHCKTLFLKDKKGALWLCVVEEHRRMNMRVLPELLGSARLSFAQPEQVKMGLGVEPGAVTPFALINDRSAKINVTLDMEAMADDIVNFHPLVNNRTTSIAPQDLIRFIEACGHEPALLNFKPATVCYDKNKDH